MNSKAYTDLLSEDTTIMKRIDVTIFIPSHCSDLSLIQSHSKSIGVATQKLKISDETSTCDNTERDKNEKSFRLEVYCHLDRIVWNIFEPLFMLGDRASSIKAIFILLKHFKHFIRDLDGNILNIDIEKNLKEENENFGSWKRSSTHHFLSKDDFRTCIISKEIKEGDIHTIPTSKLDIMIFPPYLSPASRHGSLYTEKIFTSALVRQENLNIRLQTLNGFVATMGGGYFLCRFLSTAVKLARYQRRIALLLDDKQLAMKCTVNEAYNYIHAGQVKKAKILLRQTKRQAKMRGYKIILGMCKSAKWFATQVEKASLREIDLQNGRQATQDDLLRIRIQRDRDIHESNVGKNNTPDFVNVLAS